MSYVDLKTKKIVGAKEGTLSYYHEEGHIAFNEMDKGVKTGYRQQFYLYTTMTSFILGFFFSKALLYSSLAFLVLFWYYFIYEEIWCWKFALNKMKGGVSWSGKNKNKR